MFNLLRRLPMRVRGLAILVAGLACAGFANAANYSILLKSSATSPALPCATGGGVAFTKSGPPGGLAGNNPVSITLASSCLGMPNGTYNGAVSVIVENVTLNGQAQGPNVVGLNGTLTRAGGTETIVFGYAAGSASTGTPVRPLTLAGGTQPAGGYHLFNADNNTVPEPGSIWLVLAGLAVPWVARRARRGRS